MRISRMQADALGTSELMNDKRALTDKPEKSEQMNANDWQGYRMKMKKSVITQLRMRCFVQLLSRLNFTHLSV